MKPCLSASLLLAGACGVLPLAHAADELALPATQIQSSSDQADGQSQGYAGKTASSTTRLGLSDKENPQAVTTVTRQELDDFRLNSVKQALRAAPSVTVEQTETDRTEFTSRGFDIGTFEYDGMGMPFTQTLLAGDQDMAEFEQVDILHGANGLMSGAGNPSATVNFVRKRPTDTAQAKVGISVGAWDTYREDVDVSGPLTDSGNVRGRFIYAHDKGNSYLDRYSHETTVAAGLLAFDLTDADTLTVGFSQHDSDSNGSTWGNLPLVDADGNAIHYSSRSSNIGQKWTYWDVHTQRAFAELKHDFGNGWNSKLTVTGVRQTQDTDMFYIQSVAGDDALSYPTHITSKSNQLIGEAQVSGPFSLFGREHDLTFGANYGRSHLKANEHDLTPTEELGSYYLPSFAGALAGTLTRPDLNYTYDTDNQNYTDTEKSLYAGARFSLADDLHWIVGARMLSADASGLNYGSDYYTREHGKVTPYTGLVYDLNDQWSLYGSWTKIYAPNYIVDANGKLLAPLEGVSEEIGVKGALDSGLNVTAALFKTRQQNVGEATGAYIGSQAIYDPQDYKSHGIELQADGELAPGLDILAGYTYVRIDDDNGDRARRYVPTHSVRGLATYRLPFMPKAKVGTRLSWQGPVQSDVTSEIRQNAYALVDLMASYDIDSHWSTALNLNNVTDRKYLQSLYNSATTANYGAPRNVTASLTWTY
ncbi:TonB-dependent siderophore receptor [Pseudomonas sp. HR96]|uniref:TonB-dependent siderophore receptor n=1 Tax=Pseudomonas sp. HR96 TaxID=1027966 RepID=UPI002A75309E|nr:TonB-dependent siderophore receptor [Pseudomonas sp. HR96]WPP01904.1 TonB-dependent siderophore receptor [Pseudomonas sp. HR96]